MNEDDFMIVLSHAGSKRFVTRAGDVVEVRLRSTSDPKDCVASVAYPFTATIEGVVRYFQPNGRQYAGTQSSEDIVREAKPGEPLGFNIYAMVQRRVPDTAPGATLIPPHILGPNPNATPMLPQVSEAVETFGPLTTEQLVAVRHNTHGDWHQQSGFAQELKALIRENGGADLPAFQAEALEMIAVKISRILAGNNMEPYHWDDIAGYARLGREGHEGIGGKG